MAIDFRNVQVKFDQLLTGGVISKPGSAVFNGTVHRATVVLSGFKISFANGEHPLLAEEIRINQQKTSFSGNHVDFTVDFLLRDASGNIDDPFVGFVEVVVIADVG